MTVPGGGCGLAADRASVKKRPCSEADRHLAAEELGDRCRVGEVREGRVDDGLRGLALDTEVNQLRVELGVEVSDRTAGKHEDLDGRVLIVVLVAVDIGRKHVAPLDVLRGAVDARVGDAASRVAGAARADDGDPCRLRGGQAEGKRVEELAGDMNSGGLLAHCVVEGGCRGRRVGGVHRHCLVRPAKGCRCLVHRGADDSIERASVEDADDGGVLRRGRIRSGGRRGSRGIVTAEGGLRVVVGVVGRHRARGESQGRDSEHGHDDGLAHGSAFQAIQEEKQA